MPIHVDLDGGHSEVSVPAYKAVGEKRKFMDGSDVVDDGSMDSVSGAAMSAEGSAISQPAADSDALQGQGGYGGVATAEEATAAYALGVQAIDSIGHGGASSSATTDAPAVAEAAGVSEATVVTSEHVGAANTSHAAVDSDAAQGGSSGGQSGESAALLLTQYNGVQLHLSSNSRTGYRGVSIFKNDAKPYLARLHGSILGCFATAVEAAAAYAAAVNASETAVATSEHVGAANTSHPTAESAAAQDGSGGGQAGAHAAPLATEYNGVQLHQATVNAYDESRIAAVTEALLAAKRTIRSSKPVPVPGAEAWKIYWAPRSCGKAGAGDTYWLTPSGARVRSGSEAVRWMESGGRGSSTKTRWTAEDEPRKKHWTAEEEATLSQLVAEHGERKWQTIADLMPGRTASCISQHWALMARRQPSAQNPERHRSNPERRQYKDEWESQSEEADSEADSEAEVSPGWVQCDRCQKWRSLPPDLTGLLPDVWYCEMHPDQQLVRATTILNRRP